MTIYFDMDGTFSSPLGDGLVLHETYFGQAVNIFVPAWGWVGSRMIKSRHTAISKFSSPSGDGLVPMYSLSLSDKT